MFTGLAEGTGIIKHLRRKGDHMRICIAPEVVMDDLKLGDSVAVDGVCLTVVDFENHDFFMDVSGETLSRSTLGRKREGDRVNLERALRLSDRLGGHLVLGHVDGLGKIIKKQNLGDSWRLRIEIETSMSRYTIAKGSIAVDGISLTINACEKNFFEVNIIPHTGSATTLLKKSVGDAVNIETDLIGKYVEKLLSPKPSEPGNRKSSGIDLETLYKYGFGK